jgi:hypothetical protein
MAACNQGRLGGQSSLPSISPEDLARAQQNFLDLFTAAKAGETVFVLFRAFEDRDLSGFDVLLICSMFLVSLGLTMACSEEMTFWMMMLLSPNVTANAPAGGRCG